MSARSPSPDGPDVAQLQRALAAGEARLRTVLERSSDGVMVVDAEGVIVFANAALRTLLGLGVGDAFGWVKPGGGTQRLELLRPTGERLVVEVHAQDLEWDGAPASLLTVRDVTQLARATERGRVLSQILGSVEHAIVATDLTGQVVYWSPSAERIYGWSEAEAIGRTVWELTVAQPSMTLGREIMQRLERGERWQGEFLVRRKDGSTFLAHVTDAPILDGNGALVGVVGLSFDTSERRRTEDALKRSEASFRALIERAPDGICVQRDGCIAYANPRLVSMLGYERAEQLVGLQTVDTVAPRDRDRLRARQRELAAGGSVAPEDLSLLRADGRELPVESATLRIDFDGKPAALSFLRDLTDRKELQARLMLADRMVSVGTLAAGVAHEINNPLAFVLVNLGFAAEELRRLADAGGSDGERLDDIGQALQEAREGAERVRAIVRDLKTFSRGDDERLGPVDLVRVVENAVSMAWNEIRHRARFTKDFAPVPHVWGNDARLGQVMLNLLVNAAQSLPEGARASNEIRVVLRAGEEGQVVVEVHDTGCGMSPEVLAHAFDPFFTTKPSGVGTGLGLSICQRIVSELGGELRVQTSPGKGSVFGVVLRASDAVEEVAPPVSMPPDEPTPRGRILVIDDEPLIGAMFRRALGEEHEIRAATSAREALVELVSGDAYDVVFCDLLMPEMTGMDLHAEVQRTAPALLDRLVFITGGAFSQRAQRFLSEQGVQWLEKPLDLAQLRRVVRQKLERRA